MMAIAHLIFVCLYYLKNETVSAVGIGSHDIKRGYIQFIFTYHEDKQTFLSFYFCNY